MPKHVIAKYQNLLDILSEKRVSGQLDDLSAVIDEATAMTAIAGTPRVRIEGFGPLPLLWSYDDWYAVRFDRKLPILGFYRDQAGKPIFYTTPRRVRRIVDLFGGMKP